ncbi:hypothetical protein BATDEDRAFT_36738 [Batrachochytrium dendrobatidis JAM81]|uniref:SCP domain-containing protein n=2 Tax=Batrachochytrium dendrobatidis TaxID=109871 RepID=F4NXQ2_BATDJ|nr:uncharacterized protein BATDEDRAFT_36738 [Batrachochytrium dendrobatidis JAM81]EGF81887.1 hypothetical protein BATDEDRAFT_36738 [Batrachochytrium dendrobatidis JAM81]KAK5670791.1 hypothetical protein QVD99_002561 [Batrachochytrium dendrobatidis]OAJ40536.1 hypothetical protein BDEG_24255 [Batrachochytrium dendrobatidis JEL423]|eukprot:XP_006677480.1 hypothetical protein BATDEDRAFT_36738 [Batrachochytrium dendrobatidis JAM81]
MVNFVIAAFLLVVSSSCTAATAGATGTSVEPCDSKNSNHPRETRKRTTRRKRRSRSTTTTVKPSVTRRPTTNPLPQPAPTSVQPPAPQPTTGGGNLGEFQQDCLNTHNRFRAIVGVNPLSWSAAAEQAARTWANHLASTGLFEHSKGAVGKFGENLYWSSRGVYPCSQAIQVFFDERKNYNGEPIGQGNFSKYGHYTQLVWPTTTQLGCALAGGNTVCEYSPPGNITGQRAPR